MKTKDFESKFNENIIKFEGNKCKESLITLFLR